MKMHDIIKVRQRIEELREDWSQQANGIERTHGDDDPAARAFRACVGDLYSIQEDIEEPPRG